MSKDSTCIPKKPTAAWNFKSEKHCMVPMSQVQAPNLHSPQKQQLFTDWNQNIDSVPFYEFLDSTWRNIEKHRHVSCEFTLGSKINQLHGSGRLDNIQTQIQQSHYVVTSDSTSTFQYLLSWSEITITLRNDGTFWCKLSYKLICDSQAILKKTAAISSGGQVAMNNDHNSGSLKTACAIMICFQRENKSSWLCILESWYINTQSIPSKKAILHEHNDNT